ncbi:16S rRNA (guanine(527)-N(7))-methyltransferase RsmG [Hoyosella subflava]|uniref:Ribosomal RNA small subunit methyltransferase G n=1 Tax=Hoyosella subflava (strain DSM 45089 / JCM 17490 / NBRC 109087 / DQS3-9A1) TaxID=443218 RepID=F6EPG4_HOYSD|nr:16S rRNA (guanine(527)-N(7))-methyltransferase RsmG [Hoyosella subflava]AEF43013.1 Ribosomal RNA small subunit methyltransferase G [Hoyosella subflava DQS3-9A1]
MKHIPDHLQAAVTEIFGDRIDNATKYHDYLASEGVTRGVIGPRETDRIWDRHILNSAAIGELIPENSSVVDIGSGGGLPGIPLAIARPDLQVTLVEPMLRRTQFLLDFLETAELNVVVVRGRAEQKEVVTEVGGADIVTSRAVAPLLQLMRWSLPLLHDEGVALAVKGESAREEVARDMKGLPAIGAGEVDVLLCGQGVLEVPTTVVRVRKSGHRKRSLRRKGN